FDIIKGTVPLNSTTKSRFVKLRHQVAHFGLFFKRQETMGKAFRNKEHLFILCTYFYAKPLIHSGRTFPDIYNNIIDGTTHTAYQLCLCVGRFLIMHTPESMLIFII